MCWVNYWMWQAINRGVFFTQVWLGGLGFRFSCVVDPRFRGDDSVCGMTVVVGMACFSRE